MLDHVFTDAISALRDAFEAAFLERQAFEEHFQVDVLLGDVTWETSYGLPGEGQPPRVVAHVTFDWPSWSQTAYRRWYVDEELDTAPAIEMEIVLRIQRLAETPNVERVYESLPSTSVLVGDGRLERAGLTVEVAHPDPTDPDDTDQSYALEVTYEGLYELAEETLADGTSSALDEHFGALGGWVASTLVRLGDLRFAFLPADDFRGRVTGEESMSERSDPVLLDVSERIAVVTLNRPEARNALSSDVVRQLPQLLTAADSDDDVDVIILTGADPAFCAGLDLVELASEGGSRLIDGPLESQGRRSRGPLPPLGKPLIGAINGPAITGGFELALNCDFLVASERATFGDTHTRLGIVPAWGLSVLLPQAIGVRRAREMSFTGNFVDAAEALALGLVNHVVAHAELIPFTRRLAADIAGNDQAAVRQMRTTYGAISHDDDAWETEARTSRAWQRTQFSPEQIAARRQAVIEHGREQQ